jgi:hypothetical protein
MAAGVPPEEVQRRVEELMPRWRCVKKGRCHVEKGRQQLQRVGSGWSRPAVDLVLYRCRREDLERRDGGGSGAEGDREWGVAAGSGSDRVGVGFLL